MLRCSSGSWAACRRWGASLRPQLCTAVVPARKAPWRLRLRHLPPSYPQAYAPINTTSCVAARRKTQDRLVAVASLLYNVPMDRRAGCQSKNQTFLTVAAARTTGAPATNNCSFSGVSHHVRTSHHRITVTIAQPGSAGRARGFVVRAEHHGARRLQGDPP